MSLKNQRRSFLVVLFLVFVFCLVGCKTDDQIKELEEDVESINSTIETINTTLTNLASKSAEKTALDELKTKLDSVSEIANTLRKEAASLVVFDEELTSLIRNLQITKTDKTTLDDELKAINSQFEEVAAELAGNKEAAEAAIAELNEKLAANKETTEAAIAAATAQAQEKITELAATVNANKEATEAAVQLLKTEIATNKDAAEAAIAALTAKVDGNEAAVAAAKAELKALVTDLQTVVQNNKAAAESDLNAFITTLQQADATNKAELVALINELKTRATATEAAIVEINAKIVTINEQIITANNAIAALQTQVAANKGEYDAKVADLEAFHAEISPKIAAAATKAELEAAIAGFTTLTLEDVNDAIVTANVAIEARIEEVEEDVAELQNTLVTLGEKVDGIDYIDRQEYVEASQLLIGAYTLSAEQTTKWEDIKTTIIGSVGDSNSISTAKPYSLEAWQRIVSSVDAGRYGSLGQFAAYAEKEQFFLGRDIKVDEIIARFEQLKQTIENLPTIEQLFHSQVEDIEFITVSYITEGTPQYAIWEELTELSNDVSVVYANGKIVNDTQYAADIVKYNKLIAARNNLIEAKNESAIIKSYIDTIVLVTGTEQIDYQIDDYKEEDQVGVLDPEPSLLYGSITEISNYLTSRENVFFGSDDTNAFYPEGYGFKEFIGEDLEKLDDYKAQLAALQDAEDALTTMLESLVIRFINTTDKPIFNSAKYNAVNAEFESINTWAETNELEDANRDYIYEIVTTQTYATASDIDEWVTELNNFYNEKVIETEMIEKVSPVIADGYIVEYKNKAELEGYQDLLDDILTSLIAETNPYNDAAQNTEAIYLFALGEDANNKYTDVVLRLQDLDEANTKLVAIDATLEGYRSTDPGKTWNVGFADAKPLFDAYNDSLYYDQQSVRGKLDFIYADYEIDVTDQQGLNYDYMAKAIEAKYSEIGTAYDNLAEELRKAAEAAGELLKQLQGDPAHPLLYASDLNKCVITVGQLITEYKINDQDIRLSYMPETEATNFKELLEDLNDAATNATAKAALAEEAYNNAATEITALTSLTGNAMLNDKAIIDAAYDKLIEWIDTYFVDVEDATALAAELAKVGADDLDEYVAYVVANVQTIDDPANEGATLPFQITTIEYVFFTVEEATAIISRHDEIGEVYELAKAEWDELSPILVRLSELSSVIDFSIHEVDNFRDSSLALDGFIGAYYRGTSTYVMENEQQITDNYYANYALFDSFYTNALAARDAIYAKFNSINNSVITISVPTIATDNAEAASRLVEVNDLAVLINDFNVTYDNVITEDYGKACNEWFKEYKDTEYEEGLLFISTRTTMMVEAVGLINEKIALVSDPATQDEIIQLYNTYIRQYLFVSVKTIENAEYIFSTFKTQLAALN